MQNVLHILIGSFQDEIHHGQSCELHCCVGKLSDTRGDILTIYDKVEYILSVLHSFSYSTDYFILGAIVTYTEALCEEGLVTDWRKRDHHNHGEQARERDDLASLEDCGYLWLGLVDLTYENDSFFLLNRQAKYELTLKKSDILSSITFLSNLTLSCQALLRRGVYEY